MTERTEDDDTGQARPEPEPAAPVETEPFAAEAERQPPPAEPAEDAGDEPRLSAPPPAVPPARRGLAVFLALLAVVVALAAAAGTAWLAWNARGEDDAAAANRRAIDSAIADFGAADAELRSAVDALGKRVDELESLNRRRSARLDDLEDGIDSLRDDLESLPPRVASLEGAVSSLAGISAGSRRAWLLAEAEHYMQIANAELQLAGDPAQALLALRFAEERIRSLEDPSLTGVRRALADEIRALESLETPDIAGVTMTLASLADSVDSLPLAQEASRETSAAEAGSEPASGWRRAVASVKSALASAITVRRTDQPAEPLLAPEAEYFLRENLKLRLQIARLALLRGEQATFEQALDDAAGWLREYYATDTRAVESALETLAGIREADWTVSAPDITASLRLLRELRERREAEVPPPEPPEDEPAQ